MGGVRSAHGYVTNEYKILVGKPEGKKLLESLHVDVRIILKSILRKSGGSLWTGSIWLRIGTDG
jgi:hypothetical protein